MLGTLIGIAAASKIVGEVAESVMDKKEAHRIQKEKVNRKESLKTFAQQNPNTMAIVATEFYELIEMDYDEVTNSLIGMGFINIHYKANTIKEGWFNLHKKEYSISDVTINGSSEFEKGDVFSKDAYVQIEINLFSGTPLPSLPEELTRYANMNAKNARAGLYGNAAGYRYCEYCGSQVVTGDNFCDGCGAPLK